MCYKPQKYVTNSYSSLSLSLVPCNKKTSPTLQTSTPPPEPPQNSSSISIINPSKFKDSERSRPSSSLYFVRIEEPIVMKKLYRKGTVHPTPPLISDHLSFLPATILTLTVALSPEDREVLAYLISCSSSNFSVNRKSTNRTVTTSRTTTSTGVGAGSTADHPPSFNCYCFRCYMSYWVRWDSSPNRQLIHEIIDAFEDSLLVQNKKEKGRKERRKGKGPAERSGELKGSDQNSSKEELPDSDSVKESSSSGDVAGGEDACGKEEGSDKGSVRRFVSFLGEKIWGVWT